MPALYPGDRVPFDLDCTLSCGQLFRWEYRNGWWEGVVGRSLIRVRQTGSKLEYEGANKDFIRHYFQLDVDLEQILVSIDRDPVIHQAIMKNRGLRICSQEPWECLASFICAQNTNIPRIKRMIANIAGAFGDPLETRNGCAYTFPRPQSIASGNLSDLSACMLGYRSRYLLDTARMVACDPEWVDRVRELPYIGAKHELMKFRGIGPKVADCILLFSFAKYEAFPVDVWIRKIMYRHYLQEACRVNPPGCREYDFIGEFARNYFGEYAGYAQEYLFAAYRGV